MGFWLRSWPHPQTSGFTVAGGEARLNSISLHENVFFQINLLLFIYSFIYWAFSCVKTCAWRYPFLYIYALLLKPTCLMSDFLFKGWAPRPDLVLQMLSPTLLSFGTDPFGII